jgi:hypothetical protein
MILILRSAFEGMLSLATIAGQRGPIVFCDPWTESASVIKTVLDLIHIDIREFGPMPAPSLLHRVVEFANKWDMSLVPNNMSKEIVRALHDKEICGIFYLPVALQMSNHKLAQSLFASTGNRKHKTASTPCTDKPNLPLPTHLYSPHEHEDFLTTIVNAGIGDLGALPFPEFQRLPTGVVYALLRAKTEVTTPKSGGFFGFSDPDANAKWPEIAKAFRKNLDKLCKYPHAPRT